MRKGLLQIITFALLAGLFGQEQGAVASLGLAKPKKVLEVGVIFRFKDGFNDTLSYTMGGVDTAKALFEKAHPETQIRIRKYSHDGSLQAVLEASRQAIDDGVSVVIGGELSEWSFVLRDQLGPKKIVLVTPTSSNPDVTEGHPYAFRICFSDRWVASELAQFTLNRLKPKAIGMIHDVSSPFTDFQSKQFIESFKQLMAKLPPSQQIPMFVEKIVKDTVNFDTQIQKFQENKVTHVVPTTQRQCNFFSS